VFSRFSRALKNHGNRFVQYTAQVIYGQEKMTPAVRSYATFLKILSLFFGLAVFIRTFLYNARILRKTFLGCKIVVIGNLTVGGTGKTPVTEKMARVLSERGRKVVIISRGYKSRADPLLKKILRWLTHGEKPKPRVVSDGKNLLLGSDEAGDEPYMLARNLLPLGVVVLVHRNRVDAGSYALRNFGCDTILLDDGLQYLPLHGQINLLLVDSTNPFGNGSLLPRGILREPVRNLKRGHSIFLTKSDGSSATELKAHIRKYNSTAPIVVCAHAPRNLSSLDGTTSLPLGYLKGRRVATFSGIATPERFEQFVRENGGQILHNQRFLDHHRFSEDDLVDVFDEAVANDAELVVTTEKDAVRINPGRKWKLPLYYLRLEIEILSDQKAFNYTVARICDGNIQVPPADVQTL
jgi:tetraacyldisaccharide 4'-kinase